MTRVVAGALGGRRLEVPRGSTVRPTSDRVREALFATLGARVPGAAVLDLYAGSGALGIEALSRGAGGATFVERDRAVARVLRANLDTLGLAAQVHVGDVAGFIDRLDRAPLREPFSLLLCDPPYGLGGPALIALLRRLVAGHHVAAAATMVVERARHGQDLEVSPDVGAVTDVRTYGDTVLYYVAAATSDGNGGPDNASFEQR